MLIAIVAAFVAPVEDPDFWWHIRVGRWILDHGQLPAHDLFTYTVSDHLWTDHEYLAEILMWLVFAHAGLLGIALAFGAITWAGFVLILAASRPQRHPYVVVGLVIALAAIAGGPIWGPRAQMITFALACLELLWLRRYLEGSSRAIRWMPLVMVGWANLHGGWVAGFVFLAIAVITELLRWGAGRRPEHLARARLLALVTAACGLAVLATPHGASLLLYPFQTQGSAAQQRLIVEWFSPDFHNNALRGFEAMVLLALAAFAIKRPSLFDLLLTLATLGLALQSVRHVALFVAATTPMLVAHLSAAWPARLGGNPASAGGRPAPRSLGAVTVLALAAITVTVGVTVANGALKQADLTRKSYPVDAADWLERHPEVGTRMYNQYGWGGYLVNRFYPDQRRRVYIFGEAALMGDAHLTRYQDVQTLRADWRAVLDGDRVDYVVYNRGEALANVLATQPEWTLVYQDGLAVIYVRRTAL